MVYTRYQGCSRLTETMVRSFTQDAEPERIDGAVAHGGA